MDYADFEGVIPQGEYGAGLVMVWDGNQTERDGALIPVVEGVAAGHVSVWLEGEKLRGGYALTRMRRGPKEAWLLVTERDEAVDARRNPRLSRPESVISGGSLEQVARDGR